ncbi:aminoglycoside adenylyltransferase domain-containing protein [Clostridium sp. UBA1056]|uniref:aminoglycoside adenylyltransferase domain-containing protein n=1 Tax=unclassified Clostridium TaxID=2614128 RepID=UPI003216EA52
MMNVTAILENIVNSYKNILNNNLIGIYLHGSLVMNCFNPDISDIDFLVIVREPLDVSNKRKLIDILLEISKDGPGKGFEMSVILEKDAKNFRYPTPYILHYSNLHKANYESDYNYLCEDGEDSDLAAHITVIMARGICIYGKPREEVFSPIPRNYYLKSVYNDIEDSRKEIIFSPVYKTLNLCRVLYYLKEGYISSKKEGGQWACSNLPKEYINTVEEALNCYEKGIGGNFDKKDMVSFADFMMKSIDNCLNSEL